MGDFRHVLDARGLQQANYGYTGIVVAALARYNPFAVVLVAFLLGGLQNAGYTLQGADFPSGLVGVMQGMILFAMLGGELLVQLPDHDRPSRPGRAAARGGRGVNTSIVVVVLASAVAYGTPLLYAALGELLAERSGVLNLGVEGMMLVGAVTGFLSCSASAARRGSRCRVAVAVAALGGRGGGARARVPRDHAPREPDRLRARADDPLRRGRALVVPRQRLRRSPTTPRRFSFGQLDLFGLGDLPVVGPIVFGQTWLVYVSWVCVARGRALPGPHAAGPRRCARSASRPPRRTRWGSPSPATGTCTRSRAARSPGSAARASAWR